VPSDGHVVSNHTFLMDTTLARPKNSCNISRELGPCLSIVCLCEGSHVAYDNLLDHRSALTHIHCCLLTSIFAAVCMCVCLDLHVTMLGCAPVNTVNRQLVPSANCHSIQGRWVNLAVWVHFFAMVVFSVTQCKEEQMDEILRHERRARELRASYGLVDDCPRSFS